MSVAQTDRVKVDAIRSLFVLKHCISEPLCRAAAECHALVYDNNAASISLVQKYFPNITTVQFDIGADTLQAVEAELWQRSVQTAVALIQRRFNKGWNMLIVKTSTEWFKRVRFAQSESHPNNGKMIWSQSGQPTLVGLGWLKPLDSDAFFDCS